MYGNWCMISWKPIDTIWSHYQSYEPAKIHSLMPVRSLCGLWHHWSFYPPTPSIIVVWSQWQGSLVALIILGIPQFCCEYKLLCLRSVSTHSGGSSRFCTWYSSLHSLHHPPQSALLSLTHHAVIIFMLMTLNYSFPSPLLISLPTSYTYKQQSTLSPSGCLQISFHLIKLRLSFSSLAYLLSSLKSLIPLYSCLLM